jgi:stress-induced morphogen
MATIIRGSQDELVLKAKAASEEYEIHHPGAATALYRQNSGSVRVRIIDDRFRGQSKGQRHDYAWGFISDRLDQDSREEVSMLILLTPDEVKSSVINSIFDDPIPSHV